MKLVERLLGVLFAATLVIGAVWLLHPGPLGTLPFLMWIFITALFGVALVVMGAEAKPSQYVILYGVDTELPKAIDGLRSRVALHLRDGWEAQGGISIAVQGDLYVVSQAIVKE
jgi:hypothetical protein